MTGTTLTNSTSQVDLASYGTGNPFSVGSGVSIVNSTAGQTAIYGDASQAWTLSNAGTVGGAVGAVNSGGDTGYTGGLGVQVTGTLTLTNSGRIAGGDGGAGTYYGGSGGGGVSISGAGIVTNTAGAAIIGGDGSNGHYGGNGAAGVSIGGFGTIVNQAGATITAGSGGGGDYFFTNGDGGDGIVLSAGGSVSNAGTITGGNSSYPEQGGVGVLFEGSADSTLTNSGIISGGSSGALQGKAVQFGAGDDRLILSSGSALLGGADGGAGSNVLELGSSGPLARIHGLGTALTNFQTIIVDPGSFWNATGTTQLSAFSVLTVNGSLKLIDDAQLAGTIDGSGALSIEGTATVAADTALFVPDLNVRGAMTVDDTLTYAGRIHAAARSTISIASGETLTLTKGGDIDGTVSGYGTLALAGAKISAPHAQFKVGQLTMTGAATLMTDDGSAFISGALDLGAAATIAIGNAWTLVLSGVSRVAGILTGASSILTLAGGRTTVTGSGKITVAQLRLWTGAALTVNGKLSHATKLKEVAGSKITVGAQGIFSVTDGAQLSGTIAGAGTLALKGGATTLASVGVLKVAGLTLSNAATLTVKGGLSYAGKVTEGAGTKIVVATGQTVELTGAITGSGAIDMSARSTLIAKGTVAAAEKATFTAKTGELQIVNTTGFKAGISGFVSGDRIDIANSAFKFGTGEKLTFVENAAKTGGTLALKNGDSRLALHLFGQYVAQGFHLAGDGHGGTLITYKPPVTDATNHLATGGHG